MIACEDDDEVDPSFGVRIARVPIEDQSPVPLSLFSTLLLPAFPLLGRERRTAARQRLEVVQQALLVHLVRAPLFVVRERKALRLGKLPYVNVLQRR